MKWKVILKTTHKNIDRVDNCVTTWLSGVDYVCLTDHVTGLYNELSGSKSDLYESNEEKTVTLINLIRETDQFDDYDWLVLIDDDAILNVEMFKTVVEHMDKSFVYGLNMRGSYKKDPSLNYASGGASYYISPSVIKGKQPMKNQGIGWEDVSMGIWMRENNIPLEESITIGGAKYKLRLNGWFPFPKHFNNLNSEKEEYAKEMIKNLTAEENRFLREHLTHHYIKSRVFMEYINNEMKKPQ
jgi:hypothetical protein